MKDTKKKEIVITGNSVIKFAEREDGKYGNLLILGNFNGFCGKVQKSEKTGKYDFVPEEKESDEFTNNFWTNIPVFLNTVRSKGHIYVVGSSETINYFSNAVLAMINRGYFHGIDNKKVYKHFHVIDTDLISKEAFKYYEKTGETAEKANEKIHDFINNRIFKILDGMKFDNIIQNPPYSGSLHLDFFNKGLDVLSENGKMVIVEPATWLINVRKNGKAKKYDEIKERLGKHVESVVIENLNKEFKTGLQEPFAITTVDMSKEFDTIDFTCFGEHNIVSDIYDCNLVGEYKTIWCVLNKIRKFGDMMNCHVTKKDMGGDYWYTKYAEITPTCGCSYVARTDKGVKYESESLWKKIKNGEISSAYVSPAFHPTKNDISNVPLCSLDPGKHLTDKIADNIYGTREELENWKHFIFNNKLPLFVNIVMTIDQNNTSKEFLPWLVDKQYTDEEINELFGFTDEEIKLIDSTIKKYERNSPWFRRYMCGKNSATDEEVMEYINKISE